ncbi:MAG: hypothetical protein RIB59_10095 [Rhodospirillales bacterium]
MVSPGVDFAGLCCRQRRIGSIESLRRDFSFFGSGLFGGGLLGGGFIFRFLGEAQRTQAGHVIGFLLLHLFPFFQGFLLFLLGRGELFFRL